MTDWSIPRIESTLRSSAGNDLPVLALADDVSYLLCEVVQQVRIEPQAEDPGAKQLRLQALWFMAVIALRALRAAMNAMTVGYEDQAVGYQRLIDELHNRAQRVRQDQSGEYSKRWLTGRNSDKGAKLAGQDFWEILSGPVHASANAVLDWVAVSANDGSTKIVIGPERRPEVANAALTYMAGEARDLANMLALEAGEGLNLAKLDGRIRDAQAEYIPDGGLGD
jgi:hypothetical protein